MDQNRVEQNQIDKKALESLNYPYVSKALLFLFCGYVIIWYLQIGDRIHFLGSIRFEFIYATILIAILIFKLGFQELYSPLQVYVVLLFLSMIVQIPFSYDFHTSWTVFINRVVKFSFMAVFIAAFVKGPNGLKYFLGAFLLACFKLGQEGFIGNITGGLVWENQGVMRLNGPTPLYAHPNSFAGMALGTVPFIYYLMPIVPLWIKTVLSLGFVFAINIIIFTASRTAYIAFLIFVFFAFLRSKFKKKFIVWGLVVALLGLPLLPQDYVDRFQSIFTGKDKEGHSTEKRKEIIIDAWQIFKDHPLGVGVAAFPAIRRNTFGRTQDTHNLYLEVATNLGIQGFIIFILFVFNMLKLLSSISKSANKQITELERELHPQLTGATEHLADLKLIYATSSATYMFIIVRLGLGMFGMDLYEIYWWFALGLTTALYNINKLTEKKTVVYQNMIVQNIGGVLGK